MKRIVQWPAMAGLAFVMVVSTVSAANAEPSTAELSGNASSVARTSDGRAVTSAAVANDVAAYWTPERMASAKNLDVVKGEAATATMAGSASRGRKPKGPAVEVAPMAPTVVDSGGFSTAAGPTTRSVGQAFFTTRQGNPASCSASTINTNKRRLVVTAAHCVFLGGWHTNFVFVPAYNNGFRPYGTFTAYELDAPNGWVNSANPSFDFAFAIMNSNGADQRIADVVGGNGYRVNWPLVPVIQFGYPGGGSIGQVQVSCQSGMAVFDPQRRVINCFMTNGASGGPWLSDFGTPAFPTLGWITGVASQGNEAAGITTSAYLDNDFSDLLSYAESRSPF